MLFFIFFPGGDKGIYIYADATPEEMKFFYTPYEFGRISLRDETVYGIDVSSTAGDYQLLAIDLLY